MSLEEYISKAEAKSFMAKVLKETFDSLRIAYADNDSEDFSYGETGLLFPKYRKISKNDKLRVSEQELRFVFIEKFNKYRSKNLYYSVETPTKDIYTFSKDKQKIPPVVGEGQSGNFDMTIYKKDEEGTCKLVGLIEFKAGSVDAQAFREVYVKLSNPKEKSENAPSPLRFLIHMVKDGVSDDTKRNREEAVCWLKTKDTSPVPLQDVVYIHGSLITNKTENI